MPRRKFHLGALSRKMTDLDVLEGLEPLMGRCSKDVEYWSTVGSSTWYDREYVGWMDEEHVSPRSLLACFGELHLLDRSRSGKRGTSHLAKRECHMSPCMVETGPLETQVARA